MAAGRVRVNGEIAREMGVSVDPERDVVEVDGKRVTMSAPVWLALHKPPGYITTRRDPGRRRTVYDLLPEEHHGLFYAGRLDHDSEGLVLLTNQGDLANRLLHPSGEVERVYEVEVDGEPDAAAVHRLRFGVRLEDGIARVVRLDRLGPAGAGGSRHRVVLAEGRKREVRRMFDAIGHPVRRLVRVAFGPIRLGRLPAGKWRRLGNDEIDALVRAARGG